MFNNLNILAVSDSSWPRHSCPGVTLKLSKLPPLAVLGIHHQQVVDQEVHHVNPGEENPSFIGYSQQPLQ